ncbi:hemolysin family protein [Azotobacter vinelandii]|uniref:hemolysin family protein n=1 Tax=Azotobacter vinelandii TaxID=354 RepID=UPI000773448B|nr:hemolysin family protein [Azotobacter vinelandii]WKN20512.1 hemolysin family protein [Azotobacter vinelandii]
MEAGLLLLLIALNGVFAMAEIAVVSSRKARLQRLADERRHGALVALALQDDPSRFLSTIQVGITTVGVLSGALGETLLARPLTQRIAELPTLAPYAEAIALILTVAAITYLSVVVGELLPKRLALLAPETIASALAPAMRRLAQIAAPLVWLLSYSCNLLLRLIGIGRRDEPPITDEEIQVLMEQGAEAGVFHESEQAFVANVLHLDEQPVGAIMSPRQQVYAIDLDDPREEQLRRLAESPYTRVLVCRGGLHRLVGVLHRGDLLKPALQGQPIDLQRSARPPFYVEESASSTGLLEDFRRTRNEFAVVVDEFDDLQGIVTLRDVLTAIVGEIPDALHDGEPAIVRREDGSWLVDGGMGIEQLKTALDIDAAFPGEADNAYRTLAGLVMHCLQRVPSVSDHFELDGWRFEVVDMDRTRIDKVLVMRPSAPPA